MRGRETCARASVDARDFDGIDGIVDGFVFIGVTLAQYAASGCR